MSIQDIVEKINTKVDFKQLFWLATIYGVVFLTFGALAHNSRAEIANPVEVTTFKAPAFNESELQAVTELSGDENTVYASRSGKKYYYSDCSGLKRIKLENRISFPDASKAEKAGYTKAANCH